MNDDAVEAAVFQRCETQLLVTSQVLLSIRDRGTQIDLAILDFSKAFVMVLHSSVSWNITLFRVLY